VGSTYPIVDFKKKMLEMYKSSTEVVNVSYLFFSFLQDFVIQKVNYSCSKFFQIIRDMEVNGIILSGDCSNYRFGCPDRKSIEWASQACSDRQQGPFIKDFQRMVFFRHVQTAR
jgi:hypothetical protein